MNFFIHLYKLATNNLFKTKEQNDCQCGLKKRYLLDITTISKSQLYYVLASSYVFCAFNEAFFILNLVS